MAKFIEKVLVKLLKAVKADLLPHAHVQAGVGHNTYVSGEEYVIKHVIKKTLGREPKVIFDVGANVGDYAVELAANFPNAQIYCFEPVPANFAKLVTATKDLNTVNTLTALGSSEGTLQLYIGEDNDDGSMATAYGDTLQTFFPFVGQTNKMVETPMTTLDIFFGDKTDTIDLLKIDVEGHELEVLKGAKQLIADGRVSIVQFEFGEYNIFSRSFIYDFYQVLKGYQFYRIMPQDTLKPMGTYNSSLEIFRYQNILAVRHGLKVG